MKDVYFQAFFKASTGMKYSRLQLIFECVQYISAAFHMFCCCNSWILMGSHWKLSKRGFNTLLWILFRIWIQYKTSPPITHSEDVCMYYYDETRHIFPAFGFQLDWLLLHSFTQWRQLINCHIHIHCRRTDWRQMIGLWSQRQERRVLRQTWVCQLWYIRDPITL